MHECDELFRKQLLASPCSRMLIGWVVQCDFDITGGLRVPVTTFVFCLRPYKISCVNVTVFNSRRYSPFYSAFLTYGMVVAVAPSGVRNHPFWSIRSVFLSSLCCVGIFYQFVASISSRFRYRDSPFSRQSLHCVRIIFISGRWPPTHCVIVVRFG